MVGGFYIGAFDNPSYNDLVSKKLYLLVFALAFLFRILFILPGNIILGFDQVRDLSSSWSIYKDLDLKIIGPTAGNNPDLHHGILFLYYILPPLIFFGGSPIAVALWNAFFNALIYLVLFNFAKSLFKNNKVAIISACLSAVSFYLIEYSAWISNPSPTLLIVPLFFFFLWKFIDQDSRFMIPAAFFLGLSIQFELFFLYLIPVFILGILLFRKKDIKQILFSFAAFCLATLTMILTEIKYHFSGVRSLLESFLVVGTSNQGFINNLRLFIDRFFETFSQSILPVSFGKVSGVVVLIVFVLYLFKKTSDRKALSFLAVYLFTPFLMLALGYHGAPWFLISLPPAMILLASFILSKINSAILTFIIVLISIVNLNTLRKDKLNGNSILEPDASAFLSTQLAVVDYTYKLSNNEPFGINSVTNPLYINAVWSYHYEWYGKKNYGYLPSWWGGDQLHPSDSLRGPFGNEKYLYVIIDNSLRIPDVHKILGKEWIEKKGETVKEKNFGAITVLGTRL
ncbi:MAG: hypothetical protein UU32_C0022G0005 [Candidatus Woesebacteria bacterium GW2011_GWB1_41_10]|uniref:Glycosyltransferase RgtA/B/C/D-like domain-containing protein n=1 Tax=Candidatus Woesebacteria bacterium GW2011_GWB1_41_10 TaxID=1618577 RepID=A0A0G0WNU9_9BACT|nr:MAG: hypothetical protein UU32_C0022G0005 [Candidatus Woesebacteria bacterium GW2011_GWB1_41_10]